MENIFRIFLRCESIEAFAPVFIAGGTGVVVVLSGRAFDDLAVLRNFHFLRDGLLRFLLHRFAIRYWMVR